MHVKEKKRAGFKKPEWFDFRRKLNLLITRFKELKGDPHHIALGMALGVFIAVTPTIPFHTALAIVLAVVLRVSKAAAYIGIWFCNPVTIPLFYWASYRVGILMLGECSADFCQVMSMLEMLQANDIPLAAKWRNMSAFFECQMDLFYAMMAGGTVLGLVSGVPAYFITRKMVNKIHLARKQRQIL